MKKKLSEEAITRT